VLDEVLALEGIPPAWRRPDFVTTPLPMVPVQFARRGGQLLLDGHDGRHATT
jgi:hypothetical protein